MSLEKHNGKNAILIDYLAPNTQQFNLSYFTHTHGSSSFIQAKSKELRPFVAETEVEMEVIADEVH